jgi:hypothetical protein
LNLGLHKRALLLTEDERLLTELQRLDTIALRQVNIIPLLYFKTADSPNYESNYAGDAQFNDFLHSLGGLIDEGHIKTGHFDAHKDLLKNVAVVYTASLFLEQLYLVPSVKETRSTAVPTLTNRS